LTRFGPKCRLIIVGRDHAFNAGIRAAGAAKLDGVLACGHRRDLGDAHNRTHGDLPQRGDATYHNGGTIERRSGEGPLALTARDKVEYVRAQLLQCGAFLSLILV
jgi:hypothetical protein